MKDRKIELIASLIFTNVLTILVVATSIIDREYLVDEIKELKTDVAMYESMVEGLMLTNKEQHNMLLECMEGSAKDDNL